MTTRTTPHFLINWKTTVAGLITIIAAGLTAYPGMEPYAQTIGMISAGLIGFLAKDTGTSGGRISAVTGKTLDAPVSLIDDTKYT
jgi:hypothetical protein